MLITPRVFDILLVGCALDGGTTSIAFSISPSKTDGEGKGVVFNVFEGHPAQETIWKIILHSLRIQLAKLQSF